jgi:hypothetical protein
MRFGFADTEIMAICNNRDLMQESLGRDLTQILRRLLLCLHAAPSLSDLTPLPPILCRLVGNGDPLHYSVGRTGKGQILFRPAEEVIADEALEIREIEILGIGGTV